MYGYLWLFMPMYGCVALFRAEYVVCFFAWNSSHLPRQFVSKQLYILFCAFCWEPFANKWYFASCNICTLRKLSRSKAHWNVIAFLELKIIHAIQRRIATFLIWYQETLFINLPFFKAYQRYTTAYCLPILCEILVYHRAGMSRLRDTEQEVQCTSNRKLTVQFK